MKTKIILLLIVALGFFLRMYQLGNNPPSLDWDETSMGYNAYALLKTGADEYGNKFPISIRSFDDYKPAMYTYLAIPSIAVFGLNEFAVRFPSAIMGTLAIVLVFFLTSIAVDSNLFGKNQLPKEALSLTASFFFAISPWSLQFSRAAFEANVGLTFFLFGMVCFLYSLHKTSFFYLIFCALGFAGSLYSYHSFRLVVPLLVFFSLILFRKEIKSIRKSVFIFLIVLVVLAIPVYKSFLIPGSSEARLSMVTIASDPHAFDQAVAFTTYDRVHGDHIGALFHSQKLTLMLDALKGYTDHFNFDFLFFHGDGGRQHHAVGMGMLYLWDLVFILIGMYVLIKGRNNKVIYLFLAFLLAPLPSAITTGTPHPVRAIAMIPFFQLFAAAGFVSMYIFLKEKKRLVSIPILVLILLAFLGNFAYYLHQYYVHTPIEYGDFWQYGYKQAIEYIAPIEKNYNQIIFTYKYDQPYIYYLFYRKIDPSWYQTHWDTGHSGKIERTTRDIGKYHFRNINWIKDRELPHSLIIASPDEVPANTKNYILHTISFPNGKVAFKIIET